MKSKLTTLLAIISLTSLAQSRGIDSLKEALRMHGEDTIVVNSTTELCIELIGVGNFNEAKEYAEKELLLSGTLKYKKGIGDAYMQIGNADSWLGNYADASRSYFNALKIREELKDSQGVASAYMSIGNINLEQRSYQEALHNYLRSMKIQKQINNTAGIADCYSNAGIVLSSQGKYAESINNYASALRLYEELENKSAIAYIFWGIADIYSKQDNHADAIKNYMKSLDIMKKINDIKGIAGCYSDMGVLYNRQGKFSEAKRILSEAISLSKSNGDKNTAQASYEALSKTDSATNNYKSAYENYKMFSYYKDSLFNESSVKRMTQTQMQYEFGKKEDAAKAEQDKRDAVTAQEKQKQSIIIYSVASGLLLVVVFAGFIFRSLRIARRQKKIIEMQKDEVSEQKEIVEHQKRLMEEKSQETTDNINYAKRIQTATMPSISRVMELFPNSFIFNKSRNIVSGDFYFVEKVSDSKIIFAVADSTSHGVAGSLMSILNSNLLSEAVRNGIHAPAKILDHVNMALARAFHQTGEDKEVKDGMDICLCSFDVKNMILEFSGSYNSLVIIRDKQVIELDADKFQLGQATQSYTNHKFIVESGDMLYLFSDGFADQFGGDKNKKYKYKNFTSLLNKMSDLPAIDQHSLMANEFDLWKKNFEQTDDVLVMGIRI